MNVQSTSTRQRSEGFTLIEMLVVFLIIAILVGILVPVISGAFHSAKQAAEVVEINSLATALQQFKDRFGHYPPSQIILRENGAYTTGGSYFVPPAPQDTAVLIEDLSVQYLRYFWPELVIHTDGTGVTPNEIGDINGDGTVDSKDFYDWNGNNVQDGPWFLQGDECLVFFLGGIPSGQYVDSAGAAQRPSVGLDPKRYPAGILGFSKTPKWPTQQPNAGFASAGRDGPFYEFDSGRLVDRDTDGFWEFLPLRKPQTVGGYAYFSSYDGTGYRPDDLNFPLELDGTSTVSTVAGFIEFRVNWQVPSTYPANYIGVEPSVPVQTSVRSPGPNPYTIGPPMIDRVKAPRYWKPEAFQIISPGSDNHYGQGGAIERLGSGYTTTRPGSNGAYEEVRDDDDNLVSFAGKAVKDVSAK